MNICRIAALGLFAAAVASAADPAGSVKSVLGKVQVKRGVETIDAREGLHLMPGDVLLTGADGGVGVILRDGTRIALGANSEAGIDKFVFEPGKRDMNLLLRMVRGVLTYVSGKIAELAPDAVRLETPVGIVGLRGTHFGVRLEP